MFIALKLYIKPKDILKFKQNRAKKKKTQYFKIDGVLYSLDIEGHGRTSSLEVQWTGICLPMQGTWVQSLVRKHSTCCRTMKPASCNFWANILQLLKSTHPRARAPQDAAVRSPCTATKSSPCSLWLEEARPWQQDPAQPKPISNLKTKVMADYCSCHND